MITELRWVKMPANWPYGRFKLQYCEPYHATNCGIPTGEIRRNWFDVPVIENKPSQKSLAEKFKERFRNSDSRDQSAIEHKYQILAKIATKHFKQKEE